VSGSDDATGAQNTSGLTEARGSDQIRGRLLASVAMVRVLTLVASGVPTVLAWALMSKRLDAAEFSGVSLALSLPTLSSFILPAMGARIANAVAIGPGAFQDAVVRSVRACLVAGTALVVLSVGLSGIGWSRLLGRHEPDPFPMDFAVVFVSVTLAVWIVLLIGERILIARGEVTKRILAAAVTGPASLVGVCIVAAVHGPAWAYVLPIPCAMVLAAACSLVWALRLPGITWSSVYGAALRRPSAAYGRSTLTLWLIVVEASVLVPIWLLRPIVSVRGINADVASLSIALQFATPVFSVISVVGQGLWPFYARNRLTLHRRDVLRHVGTMASVAAGLAVCYAVGLWLLFRLDLVGHEATDGVLVAMGFYIVARGAWEPPRIIFSTDQTSRSLAALCLVTCVLASITMLLLGGLAHGALAVAAVAVAFAGNCLLAPMLFVHRLQGIDPVRPDVGEGVHTTSG
jgi:hypothetical protein